MRASNVRLSATGVVLGVLVLLVSVLPASRSDESLLALLLVVGAALTGAGAACLPGPAPRAVGISVAFLGGGVLVRLLTGDADLATAWFLAALGGIGIGASVSRRTS